MKKRFFVLLLGIICIIAIVSYHHKDSPKPVEHGASAPNAPVGWQKFSDENWTLSLPDEGWEEMENSVPEIKVAAKNMDKECLVLLSKEYAIDTYSGYVTDSLRVFVENGAKIYAASQVTINGNKFVLVQMTRKYEVIWFWLTFKDGAGYNLACASEFDQDAGLETNHEFCQSIANTFQIN